MAGFATADTLSCPNKIISFTDNSVGFGLNYTWDFGDGGTGINANPTYQK